MIYISIFLCNPMQGSDQPFELRKENIWRIYEYLKTGDFNAAEKAYQTHKA